MREREGERERSSVIEEEIDRASIYLTHQERAAEDGSEF